MLAAHVAVAKIPKYASSESGDSVEIVERAKGGVSIILADGQGSGKSARTTSTMVINKAVSLLADGARDGAVARAVHDYLYAVKHGKVSSTLTIVSVDLFTKTLLVSRNSHTPVIILDSNGHRVLERSVSPIGVHRIMKPEISEIPLVEGTTVITYTDGIMEAGRYTGNPWSLEDIVDLAKGYAPEDIQTMVDHLLQQACNLDADRSRDDMTIMAVAIGPWFEDTKKRTMSVTMPF